MERRCWFASEGESELDGIGGRRWTEITTRAPEESERWDAPDALSIVVQAGLFSSNLIETANHCRHWRALFPAAEIVLALSVTDVLTGRLLDGVLSDIRLAPTHSADGQLQAAVRLLLEACDVVSLSEGALPLPPIKTVTNRPNNVNLQIAAAQLGLRLATGRYVLRVRSDFVFTDRSFLVQYNEGAHRPRGPATVFEERVLVSWLYTLNPYTIERLPLHISDWFNFGLTTDVRRLWDVPPMSFADSVYYRAHRQARHSNADERQNLTRRAVEQHIAYHAMAKSFPDLIIDYHNDPRSVDLSVDILTDNYNVCDVGHARAIFKKEYEADFQHPAKRVHCITRDDWLQMTLLSGEQRRDVLRHKLLAIQHPEQVPFPRRYGPTELVTGDSFRNRDEIISSQVNGVVFYGPYATLPAGAYRARVETSVLRGDGMVTLRVTTNEGRITIAQREIRCGAGPSVELEVEFDILEERGFGLEVVCSIRNIEEFVVTGVTIVERPYEALQKTSQYFAATSPEMRSLVGKISDHGMRTSGQPGFLLFGPYVSLPAGNYCVRFELHDGQCAGGTSVQITSGFKQTILAAVSLSEAHLKAGFVELEFHDEDQCRDVEFRVYVDEAARFTVRGIRVERSRTDDAASSVGESHLRSNARASIE